jgi:hypothetical protein
VHLRLAVSDGGVLSKKTTSPTVEWKTSARPCKQGLLQVSHVAHDLDSLSKDAAVAHATAPKRLQVSARQLRGLFCLYRSMEPIANPKQPLESRVRPTSEFFCDFKSSYGKRGTAERCSRPNLLRGSFWIAVELQIRREVPDAA